MPKSLLVTLEGTVVFFIVLVHCAVVVSVAVVVLIIVDVHIVFRCGHQMLTRGLLESEKCAPRNSKRKSLVMFFFYLPFTIRFYLLKNNIVQTCFLYSYFFRINILFADTQ